jgi:isochorismate synthase
MSASLQDREASFERWVDGVSAALKAGIDEATRQESTTLLCLPAPVAPVEVALAGSWKESVAWATPSGFELAGIGFTHVLEASGPERFRQIAERGTALLARTRAVGLLGATPISPRLFGGFAFAARAPRSELWRPFGEARFVLPTFSYLVEGGTGRFVVAVDPQRAGAASERSRLYDLGLRLFGRLAFDASSPSPTPAPPNELSRRDRPEEEWVALVESLRAEIARGSLEKVVLARRLELELEREVDPAFVLERLRQQAAECTRFAMTINGASFLGATPEWLARKRGALLETAAVAGSTSTHDREGAARLLESGKDRAEHAIVVREILRALSPLASSIEHADQPELYQLRHLFHLRTRIRATLKGSPHLLHVAEQLHPTPAVGGMPKERALEWIERHEPDERGWYAGPIGWFDAAGDGELAVALRSGVLAGRFAELYAGAGIVDRSSPAAEFAETRWKLAALLGALGLAD